MIDKDTCSVPAFDGEEDVMSKYRTPTDTTAAHQHSISEHSEESNKTEIDAETNEKEVSNDNDIINETFLEKCDPVGDVLPTVQEVSLDQVSGSITETVNTITENVDQSKSVKL